MRTTLNIDDSLIKNLLNSTHEKSKTRAVTIAIKDYLKKQNLQKILACQGSLDIEDTWQELEKEELSEYEK